MQIRVLIDTDQVRELHKLAFPHDNWPDPACTSWAMIENGRMIGYIAAKIDRFDMLYIERVASAKRGVGTRLVRHAMRQGRRWGCEVAHTYIRLKNYPSIFLFAKLGFEFFEPVPSARYAGRNVHYLKRAI